MDDKKAAHKHLYQCLAEVVSSKRKSLKMTQQQLAKASGIDRVFISNVEQGKRKPSFGSVSSIARGLNLRYSKLVGECEKCMIRDSAASTDEMPEPELDSESA
jgi:transcriptional regulator with XRE-family HTH domain